MTTVPDEDEFTELVDADFTRVDLVGKGANGVPRFLIAKQDGGAAGLMDPGFVRDLIAKAEPEAAPAARDDVTMTGSPAAIAAFIHKASVRTGDDVAKAEQSTQSQNDLPDSDFAYIESGGKKDDEGKTTPRSLRHFPVNDAAHVRNALARAPQSPFGDKALPKIRSAAKKFGIEVSKESGVADTVTKDMGPELDEGVDGLDPTIPLAAPDDDAPGDPTDPGSPAWEAIDAATATKWTSILARAKVALGVMADREMLEAAAADPDDAENAFDLSDAACAIDYAISVLAPFAVAEQSEADCGAEAMDAIGKAMAGFDASPLEAVEGFAAIAKAGRVLSSVNEERIRTAAASLQSVLQTLPAAPVADDPVTKEEAAMPADQTEQAAPEAVEKADADAAPEGVAKEGETAPEPAEAADVAKAEKEPQVVVYNAKGEVVGIVDPAKIVPVQGAAPAGESQPADPPADAAPAADPAPATDPADMTPAPAAAAGTPAEGDEDDVAKATENSTITTTQGELESLVAKAVAAALDSRAPAEDVAKAAVAGVSEEVETLKARLAAVEEQPAMPKVFTNGATPPPGTLRGQDQAPQGGAAVDVAKAAELKRTLYTGSAAEQNQAHRDMQEMAIAQLAAIRR